jgi:internalin A
LSFVEDLPVLRELHVSGNEISDLSPLASVEGLHWLAASDNLISDISPLADPNGPDRIELRNNNISDISPLKDYTWLQDLDLRGNPLNEDAYNIWLPLLVENNQDMVLRYDPVPEPCGMILLAAGWICVVAERRRKMRPV